MRKYMRIYLDIYLSRGSLKSDTHHLIFSKHSFRYFGLFNLNLVNLVSVHSKTIYLFIFLSRLAPLPRRCLAWSSCPCYIYRSIYLFIFLSRLASPPVACLILMSVLYICLSIYQSIYLSVCLSIYQSI